jgi:cobalt-zinc-cadmium efflux system membrane fusion protein
MKLHLSPSTCAWYLFATGAGVALAVWLSHPSTAQADIPRISPASVAAQASGSVQLSLLQWESLDIRPVGMASFPTLVVADGIVSVDDNATVPVYSPANGRVLAVEAEVGAHVRQGQALAAIVGAETAQAESDLAAASAAMRTARKQLDLGQATVARLRGLVDAGGGAAKDWLQAQSDLVAAQGSLDTATAAEAAARAKARALGLDGARHGGIAGQTQVLSPIAGEVIQRQLATGQLVANLSAGAATPLFTVSDLRRVWVIASVGEADAGRIRLGQPVSVSGLDDGAEPMRAKVAWVAPTLDAETRRMSVRIELPNPRLALKPQMSVRVKVMDEHPVQAIAIPSSAVVFDGQDAHCFVASGVQTLTVRHLKLGRGEAGLVEVLSGLRAGERVVVRGALFVDTVDAGASS